MTQEKNDDQTEIPPVAVFPVSDYYRVVQSEQAEEIAPIWLITFTDTIALMLTFFVLMYAMSAPPDNRKWEEITAAMSSEFKNTESKPFQSGAEDVVNIDRVETTKALDLSYLKTLVPELIAKANVKNVMFIQREDTLIVSMSSDLLYESGKAEISEGGNQILFSLAGLLSRIRNRIEIVGHTDPRPLENAQSEYKSNWELSLARASMVAARLKEAGYEKDIVVRGLSSSRFEELPGTIELEDRYARARRVDIVIMQDSGRNKQQAPLFDLE